MRQERQLPSKGTFTGLFGTDEKPIFDGDTVRYEYKTGFNKITNKDGEVEEFECIPYSYVKDNFHETIMEFKIHSDCAGYFLNKPKGISSMYCEPSLLKYFVVNK